MPRPLTVADRAPEVGDVLQCSWARWFLCVTEVKAGSREDIVRGYDTSRQWWRESHPLRVIVNWRYVSRADNGPITIDD